MPATHLSPYSSFKIQAINTLVLIWTLIKAIAKDQGFEIEITNPGFDAAISAVQAGQADGIIAGMSVADARKGNLRFLRIILHSKYDSWCKRIKHDRFL